MLSKLTIILKHIFQDPKIILKLLKAPFMSPKQVVLDIYNTKKKECPNKSEIEHLRYALISRLPFDYQDDCVIQKIIEEHSSIESLSNFIEEATTNDSLWKNRTINIKTRKKELYHRNMMFLRKFYDIQK